MRSVLINYSLYIFISILSSVHGRKISKFNVNPLLRHSWCFWNLFFNHLLDSWTLYASKKQGLDNLWLFNIIIFNSSFLFADISKYWAIYDVLYPEYISERIIRHWSCYYNFLRFFIWNKRNGGRERLIHRLSWDCLVRRRTLGSFYWRIDLYLLRICRYLFDI